MGKSKQQSKPPIIDIDAEPKGYRDTGPVDSAAKTKTEANSGYIIRVGCFNEPPRILGPFPTAEEAECLACFLRTVDFESADVMPTHEWEQQNEPTSMVAHGPLIIVDDTPPV